MQYFDGEHESSNGYGHPHLGDDILEVLNNLELILTSML